MWVRVMLDNDILFIDKLGMPCDGVLLSLLMQTLGLGIRVISDI